MGAYISLVDAVESMVRVLLDAKFTPARAAPFEPMLPARITLPVLIFTIAAALPLILPVTVPPWNVPAALALFKLIFPVTELPNVTAPAPVVTAPVTAPVNVTGRAPVVIALAIARSENVIVPPVLALVLIDNNAPLPPLPTAEWNVIL